MSKLIPTTLGFAFVCSNLATAGLVAHWPLDTDAMDASGNGYDGTPLDSPTFGQPGANAATGMSTAFPGTAHIDVPFDAALNPESFTVTLWALPNTVTGAHQSPITSRDDASGPLTHGYILYRNPDSAWDFWTGDGNANWPGLSGGAATQAVWTHIAISYLSPADGGGAAGTKHIYVNGTLTATANTPDNNTTLYVPNGTVQAENLHIGSGQDDGLNYYWEGNIDDIGLWDEVLSPIEIQAVMNNGVTSLGADPALLTVNPVQLESGPAGGAFDLEITNGGASQSLNIIGSPVVGGPDAANFSVLTVPGSIPTGGMANIECLFDPLGGNGLFEATFDVTSDDSINPNQIITVQAEVRDPRITSPSSFDLGLVDVDAGIQSATLAVQNDGATRTLTISNVAVTGPDAANFMVTAIPTTLAPTGGTGDIEFTFDPLGEEGSFSAQFEITSDDPINPITTVQLTATARFFNPLVAWWPLDTDALDASGNGHHGSIQGTGVAPGSAGANAATGQSTDFGGTGRIDVAHSTALNPVSYTVALWAQSDNATSYRSPITSRDDVPPVTNDTYGYVLYETPTNGWSFWTGTGVDSAWNQLNGPGTGITTGEWTHLAITFDAETTTKTLWINGSAEASNGGAYFANGPQAEDLHIGGGGDDGTSFNFDGRIDDVGLFRSALTADEIASIMNDGVGSMVDTRPFVITEIRRLPGDKVELTWNSKPGRFYTLFFSTDGTNFGTDAGDSFASGGETTAVTIEDGDAPIAASPTLLFKVGENPPPGG